MQALYTRPPANLPVISKPKIYIFDANEMTWQATNNPGLYLKPIRHDDENGHFLGLVRFAAFTRSGVHQHQGLATSFVINGGLTDYHGSIGLHQAGINLAGATHDAMAYQDTVLVSKLEAPVLYLPNSQVSGVHAGSRAKNFENPAPEVAPEINIEVDSLPKETTAIDGLRSQTIFDYAGINPSSRYLQWQIQPQTTFTFTCASYVEFWVRGGNLSVNLDKAYANCFVVCEPGCTVDIDCPFGALCLVWTEGEISLHVNSAG